MSFLKLKNSDMKTRKTMLAFLPLVVMLSLAACSGGQKNENNQPLDVQELTKNQPETHGAEIKEADIKLSTPLDAAMVGTGSSIYETKCRSCHKLDDQKLVGPGWKNVTKKRAPVWIMNMITNVDMMLEKDPEAQKLLEQCMVRMPNQNVSQTDARSLLEFMRKNDGEK
jgi:cytochrome c551/c552